MLLLQRLWLGEQSASKARDAGWRELAKLQLDTDPALSLAMSEQIADKALHQRVVKVALEGLLWRNPQAAEQFMTEGELPQLTRERLVQKREEFAAWKRLAVGK